MASLTSPTVLAAARPGRPSSRSCATAGSAPSARSRSSSRLLIRVGAVAALLRQGPGIAFAGLVLSGAVGAGRRAGAAGAAGPRAPRWRRRGRGGRDDLTARGRIADASSPSPLRPASFGSGSSKPCFRRRHRRRGRLGRFARSRGVRSAARPATSPAHRRRRRRNRDALRPSHRRARRLDLAA